MMDTSENTTVMGVVKELDSHITSHSKKSLSSVKTKNKFKKKHKTKQKMN